MMENPYEFIRLSNLVLLKRYSDTELLALELYVNRKYEDGNV
jgi:hypothetical protein